jgi:hypothetical protein
LCRRHAVPAIAIKPIPSGIRLEGSGATVAVKVVAFERLMNVIRPPLVFTGGEAHVPTTALPVRGPIELSISHVPKTAAVGPSYRSLPVARPKPTPFVLLFTKVRVGVRISKVPMPSRKITAEVLMKNPPAKATRFAVSPTSVIVKSVNVNGSAPTDTKPNPECVKVIMSAYEHAATVIINAESFDMRSIVPPMSSP